MTNPSTGEPIPDAVMILTTSATGGASMVKPRHEDKGLYTASVIMPSAGTYQAQLRWEVGSANGLLDLGTFTTGTDVPHQEPPSTAVTLSKEQVWQVPFAVEAAAQDTIRQQIKAAGVWLPAPGDEWVMTAPAAGVVMYAKPELMPGIAVAEGEVLFVLSAGEVKEAGAEAERVAALAEFEAADAAKRRLKSLRAAGAATLGEWEEAQRRWEVAKEARDRWADLGDADMVRVRADRAGVIRSVGVTQGTYVQPGQALARLASAREAVLEVAMSPDLAMAVENWKEAKVQTQSTTPWQSCQVVSVSREINGQDGLLPVYLSCPTDAGIPIPGSFADVVLTHGPGERALVISESALLEHYGSFEVAVQTAGEQYELRPVQVGRRGAGSAEILGGLSVGDLVVTRGAYTVRMASMKSSTPAHGHTH